FFKWLVDPDVALRDARVQGSESFAQPRLAANQPVKVVVADDDDARRKGERLATARVPCRRGDYGGAAFSALKASIQELHKRLVVQRANRVVIDQHVVWTSVVVELLEKGGACDAVVRMPDCVDALQVRERLLNEGRLTDPAATADEERVNGGELGVAYVFDQTSDVAECFGLSLDFALHIQLVDERVHRGANVLGRFGRICGADHALVGPPTVALRLERLVASGWCRGRIDRGNARWRSWGSRLRDGRSCDANGARSVQIRSSRRGIGRRWNRVGCGSLRGA